MNPLEELLKLLKMGGGNMPVSLGGSGAHPGIESGYQPTYGQQNPIPRRVSGVPQLGIPDKYDSTISTTGKSKGSSKMSQESMDAFKELRYDLEAAAKRNMPRKSFEGVDFADVKMPQPGLAVETYAPVTDSGLMSSITGGSKEQRSWEARDDDELWKLLRRGLV
jgi:hypothetical protein